MQKEDVRVGGGGSHLTFRVRRWLQCPIMQALLFVTPRKRERCQFGNMPESKSFRMIGSFLVLSRNNTHRLETPFLFAWAWLLAM